MTEIEEEMGRGWGKGEKRSEVWGLWGKSVVQPLWGWMPLLGTAEG
jgi:hypothetical protein